MTNGLSICKGIYDIFKKIGEIQSMFVLKGLLKKNLIFIKSACVVDMFKNITEITDVRYY